MNRSYSAIQEGYSSAERLNEKATCYLALATRFPLAYLFANTA
jgi:hypothetical protein